jgi:hypothetical protein
MTDGGSGAPAPALTELAALLREADGLLARATSEPTGGEPAPLGAAAAAGERTRAHARDYGLLVEAIREGYLAHYAEGRVLRSDDEDLALLAGDHLYALGLDRLAQLGDLASVEVLAGVIARSAQAQAEGRPADADAAWSRGVAEVASRGGAGSETGPNT